MPRGVATTTVGESEVLLFASGLEAIKNVVLDASTVAPDINNYSRRILKAGVLLVKVPAVSPTGKPQYQKYSGTGKIEGILALDAEFLDGSSNSDTARGMFYHGCVFRASKIVDYSLYGNVAASTLNTCKFENV